MLVAEGLSRACCGVMETNIKCDVHVLGMEYQPTKWSANCMYDVLEINTENTSFMFYVGTSLYHFCFVLCVPDFIYLWEVYPKL
jgi:hypothetical protein